MGLESRLRFNIDIIMMIFNSVGINSIFIGLAIILNIGCSSESDYELIQERTDNWYIVKDKKLIVYPSIVSMDIVDDYFVGLRLPSEHLACNNESGYKIRLKNLRAYFILSTESGELNNFFSDDDFKDRLDELMLRNKVKLSYSKFDETWNQYSSYYDRVDFSNCVPIVFKP